MKRIVLIFGLAATLAIAQDWQARYSTGPRNNDDARALVVDRYGNSYVAGYAQGIAVIKYNPHGESLWSRTWTRVRYSKYGGMAAELDSDENVIVVTAVYKDLYNGFCILKYTSEGEFLSDTTYWHSRSSQPVPDISPLNAAIDRSNNIYVGGTAGNDSTQTDIITCRYGHTGNLKWSRYFDGQRHDSDEGRALTMDRAGRVLVAGRVQDASHHWNAVVLKYDTAGTLLWSYSYMPNTNYQSWANDIGVCSNNDIYIAGWQQYYGQPDQSLVVKLNSSGDTIWTRGDSSEAHGLAVDNADNVFVTGEVARTLRTWKYGPSGQLQWKDDYRTVDTMSTYGRLACLAPNQGLYAAGWRWAGLGRNDFFVVRYSPAGQKMWSAFTDSSDLFNDKPSAADLDPWGNIILTGRSRNRDTGYDDFLTMKFRASGAVEEPGMPQVATHDAITISPSVVSSRCIFNIRKSEAPSSLRILDISGRTVRELALPSGETCVAWNVTDGLGRPVPNGVYFAVLKSPESRAAAKFLIQR